MIGIKNTQKTTPWTQTSRWDRIRRLIRDRSGLFLQDHEIKTLKQAVADRMQSTGTASVDAYLPHLTGPDGREFMELLNLLTIRHTYFLRDQAHFAALREVILPRLLEKPRQPVGSPKPVLRIWSAGCSTGEEPYSIAMIVADVVPALRDWDIQILATDVSTQALAFAQRGLYGEGSMKRIETARRLRYFVEISGSTAGRTYQVGETLRALVRFAHHNLLEGVFPDGLDVIFCRNVMIYFDRPTVEGLVDRFHNSLVEDGYLFLGPSEWLPSLSTGFRPHDHHDGVYYQKARHETAEPSRSVASSRTRTTAPEGHDGKADPPAVTDAQIEEAIKDKDYERAMTLIGLLRRGQPHRIDLHYWAAHVHVNRGDYGLAGAELEQLLQSDAFFAPAYHLWGTIHLQEQDLHRAKAALKKAIFLDPRFVMAYVTLAMAYHQEGKTAQAVREYRNAVRLLSGGPCEDEVPYSGGFTRAVLVGICQEAVERIQAEA